MNKTLYLKQILTFSLLFTGLITIQSSVADNLMYANHTPAVNIQKNQDPLKNNYSADPVKFKRFNELSNGNKKIAQALFNAQFSGRSQRPIEIELSTAYWSLEKIASKNLELNSWGHVFEQMKSKRLIKERNLGQVIRNHSDMMHTKISDDSINKKVFNKKAAIVITNAKGDYVVINRTNSKGPDSL